MNNFLSVLVSETPVIKTAMVGLATTAAVVHEADWRIVAVNAALSLGMAALTHFAARSGRYLSRGSRRRKPRSIPTGKQQSKP